MPLKCSPAPLASPSSASGSFNRATGLCSSRPYSLQAGPNNTIWFTDRSAPNAIGYFHDVPGSPIYMIPLSPANVDPFEFAFDSVTKDMWFTEHFPAAISTR